MKASGNVVQYFKKVVCNIQFFLADNNIRE